MREMHRPEQSMTMPPQETFSTPSETNNVVLGREKENPVESLEAREIMEVAKKERLAQLAKIVKRISKKITDNPIVSKGIDYLTGPIANKTANYFSGPIGDARQIWGGVTGKEGGRDLTTQERLFYAIAGTTGLLALGLATPELITQYKEGNLDVSSMSELAHKVKEVIEKLKFAAVAEIVSITFTSSDAVIAILKSAATHVPGGEHLITACANFLSAAKDKMPS